MDLKNHGDTNSQHLINLVQEFDLHQHVKEITRPASEAILDLVLSSRPGIVTSTETVPGISDHEAILATLDLRAKMYHKTPHKVYKYRHADFDSMREEASAWTKSYMIGFSNRSVDENWTKLRDAIKNLTETYVPSKMTSFKRTLPWISPLLKRKLRKRERLFIRAKRTNAVRHWDAYNRFRNATQREIRDAHANYVNCVIGNSLKEGDPKRFYSYLRLKRTENLNIPVLHNSKGYHTTDQGKAEALSDQFSSVFNKDRRNELLPSIGESTLPDRKTSPSLSMVSCFRTSGRIKHQGLTNCQQGC
jgi:hypothetical protein